MPTASDADNDWYEIGGYGQSVYDARNDDIDEFQQPIAPRDDYEPTCIAIVTDNGYGSNTIPDDVIDTINDDPELSTSFYMETGNPFIFTGDVTMNAVSIDEERHKERAVEIVESLGYDVELYDTHALYQFASYINGGILYIKTME